MLAPAIGGVARVGKTQDFEASRGWRQERDMEAMYRRCAGLDVHKDIVKVCVLPPVGQPECRNAGGLAPLPVN